MKDSLATLGCFAAGIALGWAHIGPQWMVAGDASTWALYLLLFLVGASTAASPEIRHSLRALRPWIMLIPIAIAVGSMIGSGIVSFLLPDVSVQEGVAVGAGLGYYSVSSVIINEAWGTKIAAVALLANIIRETATFIGSAFLVRWFGKLAPVAAGGATSLDVTLPTILRYSGSESVPAAIVSGAVLTAAVPFLVTLIVRI
ncbi:MAG: lysine exporter LysO family protein [Patescibacteria group bacterium]